MNGNYKHIKPTIPRVCAECGAEFLGHLRERNCFDCWIAGSAAAQARYEAANKW